MTLENYQLVERTKALYGHMKTVLVGTFALAALTVTVLWTAVNQEHLLIWFAVMVVQLLLRAISVQRYKTVLITKKNAKKWTNAVAFWSFLSGIVWGLLLVFFATPDEIIILFLLPGSIVA